MIAETLWIILLAASGFASAFVAEQLFRWSLERWGLEKKTKRRQKDMGFTEAS